MPTIEFISLDTNELDLNNDDFKVAIIEEKELKSHRGLFNSYLKRKKGVIIHIGNPDLNYKDYGFFAGMIINWKFEPDENLIPKIEIGESGENQEFKFKFMKVYQKEINKIIKISFEKSSVNEVYFLTDIQFGPESGTRKKINLKDFWKQHDSEGLEWNVLYKIKIK